MQSLAKSAKFQKTKSEVEKSDLDLDASTQKRMTST